MVMVTMIIYFLLWSTLPELRYFFFFSFAFITALGVKKVLKNKCKRARDGVCVSAEQPQVHGCIFISGHIEACKQPPERFIKAVARQLCSDLDS
jgi:hypothetical protein